MARKRSKKSVIEKRFQPTTPNHKYGLLPVNNLTYGNPNAEQSILVEKKGTFDYIAQHFMDKPYPNNDGKYAQNELTQITQQMKKLEYDNVISMAYKFDEDLKGMSVQMAEKCGVGNPEKFVDSVFKDIDSIIMKLKFFYNRIRPFQLANIYQYPLNPMPTISSHSPAYPSGHTVQSKVIADILSYKYPDQSDILNKFAEKCSNSRIILGVHYPSDEVFGLQVAAGITNDERFQTKYFTKKVLNAENNHLQQEQQQVNQDFNIQQQISPNQQPNGRFNNQNRRTMEIDPITNEEQIFGGLPQEENPIDHHLSDSQVFGGLPRQQQK